MTSGPGTGPKPGSSREHGDRRAFLAAARRRLAGDIFVNPVHAPPPTPAPSHPVPVPGYRNLDPADLPTTFADAVAHADGTCHVVDGDVPDALLDQLVAELGGRGGRPVVVSAERAARAVGARLAARGVAVEDATPERAARAGLGVTSAVAAIAATGTVVLDSRAAGGRTASLLPSVHLCVVPVNSLFPTPADVLRRLGSTADALPPSLVLVTGPSRTGDIEQLLTLGAHGPTALHVVLVTDASSSASTNSVSPA
jgi:L-lactate dehydrogenase complex protein LldG